VIASLASVSEIPDLKLSRERAFLIVLGLSRGREETLHIVRSVRQTIKVCKLVVIGERSREHAFQEFLNGGVDAIAFNVGSSDALLKVLDLALIGQQVVILGRPLENVSLDHSAPPHAVDHAHPGPITRSELAGDSDARSLSAPLVTNPHTQLSEREQQVLICVARGESNKTIARSCSITEATVKVHLQSILRKISARNRTQAALWAVENGLVAKAVLTSNGVSNGE
jgi:two-component system nitrate/nitrite response regulator NarL